MSREREIWLHLSKMAEAGVHLSQKTQEWLDAHSAQYSKGDLAEDESDPSSSCTAEKQQELKDWLMQNRAADVWGMDGWRQKCRDNFDMTADTLCKLAEEGVWLSVRWREGFRAWPESQILKKSWGKLAPVLVEAPKDELQDISHETSQWLKTIAKTFEGHEDHFFTLVNRILGLDERNNTGGAHALEFENDMYSDRDPVAAAINHPVGFATEALILWLQRQQLKDGEGLSERLKAIFSALCNANIKKYRHSRVWLAVHAITLFRADPDWTKSHLLPLFNWDQFPKEARVVWKGFLLTPRLNSSLMNVLRCDFLETANHHPELGDACGQYADFLTFAALDPNSGGIFSKGEFRRATCALPPEGLSQVALTLVNVLESSGNESEDFWTHRIEPYIREIWPKNQNKILPETSERLGHLCITAKKKFPDALMLLNPWLQNLEDALHLIDALYKSGLCERYPEHSLAFLHRIIVGKTKWLASSDLKKCLETMKGADHRLENDSRFKRLMAFSRQQGGS